MATNGPNTVDALLARLREGDEEAAGELFSTVHGELRNIARALFRGQAPGHTLQPTAIVHEAYFKLLRSAASGASWQDRAHFFSVAATAMRQVLVNHARDKAAHKRGGPDARRVTLGDDHGMAAWPETDVLDVHEALEELAKLDERQARIAELRFFAGLTTKEAAEALGIAPRTVELDWTMAKGWLARRLGKDAGR